MMLESILYLIILRLLVIRLCSCAMDPRPEVNSLNNVCASITNFLLYSIYFFFFFFFSSRRRHTRLVSDWSSDVCSSDLTWMRHAPALHPCPRFSQSLLVPRVRFDRPCSDDPLRRALLARHRCPCRSTWSKHADGNRRGSRCPSAQHRGRQG